MNQSNESRQGRRRMQPAPGRPRRPHGPQRGRRKHVRHHARHRGRAGHGLSASIQDRPQPVHLARDRRPHRRRHRHHAGRVHRRRASDHVHAQARDRLGEGRIRAHDSACSTRSTDPQGDARRTRSASRRLRPSLVTLKVPATGQPANVYTVQVKGLDATSGTYLVGFYLPGDVAGTGTVTQADIKTIKSDHGLTATNSKYTFDADVNRDGVINGHGRQDRPGKPGCHRPRSARWSR